MDGARETFLSASRLSPARMTFLSPVLPEESRFDTWRGAIRECLDTAIRDSGLPPPLQEAIRYGSTAPQASRWRALLVLEIGNTLGVDPQAALAAAAAVEALHCATLSIDDLPSMDDAAERRGLPAMHRRFNEAMAIQASLWLLGESRTLMASAAQVAGASTRVASGLAALQQQTENSLQLGQFLDMMGLLGKMQVDAEQVARLKCGRLFALAAQAAAWLRPVDPRGTGEGVLGIIPALDAFGEEVGLAYQILDDLEDAAEDGAAATWSAGGETGRPTIMSRLGHEAVHSLVEACLARAETALQPLRSNGLPTEPLMRMASVMLGRV